MGIGAGERERRAQPHRNKRLPRGRTQRERALEFVEGDRHIEIAQTRALEKTAMFADIAALQVPIIAGIFSIAGVMMTRSVTRSQVVVARQSLFASLYPTRVDWLESFLQAVNEWDREITKIIYATDGPPEPTALFELEELTEKSRALFGPEVTVAAKSILKEWEIVKGTRIRAASGDRKAAQQAGHETLRAYRYNGELRRVCRPYLYVGDIRNNSKEAKPDVRTVGLFDRRG